MFNGVHHCTQHKLVLDNEPTNYLIKTDFNKKKSKIVLVKTVFTRTKLIIKDKNTIMCGNVVIWI